jgi:serpin B
MMIIIAILLAATGCSAAGVASAGDLMADVQAAERPADPGPLPESFNQAVLAFSWTLLQKTDTGTGNLMISPASVFMALAMTMNGADGETRAAMLDVLADGGMTEEMLNQASRDWITLLQNTGDKTELYLSNAIWLRDSFVADPDFLQRNADFFGAAARKLDFTKPEAVHTINDWVKTATRGKIDSIVEQINDDVIMYLINAIYFKSDWKNPFKADSTFDGAFAAPAGAVQVPFMNQAGTMDYLNLNGLEGVWMPYVDEQLGFFAILPEEGSDVRDLLQSGSGADLAAMIQNRSQASVSLRIPKFEVRYETGLVEPLKAMGMGVAFTAGQADFSRMNASHTRDLFISDVRHKTYFRIDEKGSEAAAVTSVEVSLTSIPEYEHTLDFSRPFMYGIADANTGLPLFIGIMENPAATN